MEGLKLFMEKNALKNRTKKIKVLGINLWELLAYFIIYSILGYVIETLFALVRYGVLESRQSFLYGPFCSIYGIGAIIMIMFLQYFLKNRSTLFIGGFLIGSALEYLVSLVGELILHVKWWDYSNMPLNINGRICLYYSIFWGVLAIFLMKIIHPHVRNFLAYILKKLNLAIIKSIILAIIVFIILDCFISAYAINLFTIRMVAEYDLDVPHKQAICTIYEQVNKSNFRKKLINTVFKNEIMLKTYPNLKVQQTNGTIVYFKDLLPDIKSYYYRFQEKDFYK